MADETTNISSLPLADPLTGDEMIPGDQAGQTKRIPSSSFMASSRLAAADGSSLVGFQQSGDGSAPRTAQDKQREVVSVLDKGASPFASAAVNQAAFDLAFAQASSVLIPPGTYQLNHFNGVDNQNVLGYGAILSLGPGADTPVLASFGNNSSYEGITFKSNVASLNNVRCEFRNKSGLRITDCSFVDFVHSIPAPNAWGLYFKDCQNVTVERCYFDNNSQSDIAILEGVANLSIINAVGSALKINMEPNNGGSAQGSISIKGSTIDSLYVLENDLTHDLITSLNVDSCTINTLYYRGGSGAFTNSRIALLKPQLDGNLRWWGGAMDFGGAIKLGAALLQDPYFLAAGRTRTLNWGVSSSSGAATPANLFASAATDYGRALRINPTGASGRISVSPTSNIAVNAGQQYGILFVSSGIYPAGSGFVGLSAGVRFMDASNATVLDTAVSINRGTAGSTTEVLPQWAFVTVPAGATQMQIRLYSAGGTSTASADFYFTQVYPLPTGSAPTRNISPPLPRLTKGALRTTCSQPPNPGATNECVMTYIPGDYIENSAPKVGTPKGWVWALNASNVLGWQPDANL